MKRLPLIFPVSALFLLWATLFFSHFEETQLKMDGMTYAALAKHVVMTGDWRLLHYSAHAYADYYQHPPLFVWMTALVFRALGATDQTARLLPAGFALGTALVMLAWGTVARSLFYGLLAAIITLGSTTYLKYASDCFLDGPLTFWLVAGSLCFVLVERAKTGRWKWVLGFSVCIAAALMTKGVVGLSLPLASLAYALLPLLVGAERWPRSLMSWVSGMGLALLCLSPWLLGGGGLTYLAHYWSDSVAGRVHSAGLAAHLGPARALLTTYWPWLPFGCWGLFVWLRQVTRGGLREHPVDPLWLAFIHALVILAAFSYSGHFLEHYFLPFYPLAALFVALPFAHWLAPYESRFVRALVVVELVTFSALLLYPGRLRTLRTDPIRSASEELARRCRSREVSEVLVSSRIAEHWLAVATVLWKTPWDVSSVGEPLPPPVPSELLVAAYGMPVPEGWEKVADEPARQYALYQPASSRLCEVSSP